MKLHLLAFPKGFLFFFSFFASSEMFAHTKFSGVKVNESGESWKWGKWVLACGWYICMYISLTCLRVLHVSSVPFVPIWDLLVSFLLFLFSVRLAICKQKFLTFSFLGKILVYTCVYVCVCSTFVAREMGFQHG